MTGIITEKVMLAEGMGDIIAGTTRHAILCANANVPVITRIGTFRTGLTARSLAAIAGTGIGTN